MDDGPKSAYEIALEKLKERDRERGEQSPARLSDAQKARIAEIRRTYEARLAEREILFGSERAKAAASGEAEAIEKVEQAYARERKRIEERRDREIGAVRDTGDPAISGPGPRKRRGPKRDPRAS